MIKLTLIIVGGCNILQGSLSHYGYIKIDFVSKWSASIKEKTRLIKKLKELKWAHK